jgi:hypothetical protein
MKTQQSRILDLLKTGKWVCSTRFDYNRDARKRISELNHSGYLIEGEVCDLHPHNSRIYMRKLVRQPKQLTNN